MEERATAKANAGVLRCAQNDSKDKQLTARTNNGKSRSRFPAGMTNKGRTNNGKSRS
jgi:hypothetical protein